MLSLIALKFQRIPIFLRQAGQAAGPRHHPARTGADHDHNEQAGDNQPKESEVESGHVETGR